MERNDMKYEINRLRTFRINGWSSYAPVCPSRIAKAGFFYTGERLDVQCFSCGKKITEWDYDDQVMAKHRNLSPECVFVNDPSSSGNVPLTGCTSQAEPNDFTVGDIELNSITQDYGLTEEDEMYKSDPLRLLSYVNYNFQDTSLTREILTSAGFYHAGGGRLRCAWCGGELPPYYNFGNHTPLQIHRLYFPRCDHAATLLSESARGEDDDYIQIQFENSGLAIGSNNLIIVPQPPVRNETNPTPQSTGSEHNNRILSAGNTWRALGVVGSGARHPNKASLAARLATFERWPSSRPQSPRTLAEAGFYHTGTDDQVRCFYCDGGLGKWETSDVPWTEHARWFPHCGYVVLVKGQEFVDACRENTVHRTVSAESGLTNRRNPGINFTISDSQIEECMESVVALGALSAGLDAARVRRAIVRRLRSTGSPFATAEALIDAVLDEQLNEESWSVSPQSQRFARDILAETLREMDNITTVTPYDESIDNRIVRRVNNAPRSSGSQRRKSKQSKQSKEKESADTEQNPETTQNTETTPTSDVREQTEVHQVTKNTEVTQKPQLSLEEENRQLKEQRLCKVCMDNEVSVVFLPCGHLVSCARCGAALLHCPLCRATVKALVRAYLA